MHYGVYKQQIRSNHLHGFLNVLDRQISFFGPLDQYT